MSALTGYLVSADGTVEELRVVHVPPLGLFTLDRPAPPPVEQCDICDRPATWRDEWSKYCTRHASRVTP